MTRPSLQSVPGGARARLHPAATALAAVLALSALAGCSGDSADPEEEPASPQEVLAEAKKSLDETSGVRLKLTTTELPADVDGILSATGVATHAPAFDGDLKVFFNNLSFDVPVVSVDGTVYAQIPGTTELTEINPADYGAPDPAALMDPSSGVSSWLTAAQDVTEGDQVRDGQRVLTSYPGTLPGTAVATVIPSADKEAEFDVTFQVDDEGLLGALDVSGPFYGDAGVVDYAIEVTEYGSEPEITRP